MTEESLNCLGKTPVNRERLTMLVMVGRSVGRHCLRMDVGNGSRSQKELDEEEMILGISSPLTGLKKVRLNGT